MIFFYDFNICFFFITFTLTIPTCIAVGINTMGFDRKDGINARDISSSPQKSLDVSSKDEEKTKPPDIGVLKVIDTNCGKLQIC